MAIEAQYIQDGCLLDLASGTARSAGEIIELADGRAGVVVREIAETEDGAVRVKGVFDVPSASATTFSIGDQVWWDTSEDVAVTAPGDGADLYLGPALEAKANGDTVVRVNLNAAPPSAPGIIKGKVIEVDTESGEQDAAQNIIPASWNQNGLLLLGVYGIVTEQFGGGTEDQGIVTIEDSDGTDLCTLTASDAGADALNDVIVGTSDLFSASTGDAAKVVAAGKGVQALVSQATSGTSAAGKMKIVALFATMT